MMTCRIGVSVHGIYIMGDDGLYFFTQLPLDKGQALELIKQIETTYLRKKRAPRKKKR